MVLTSLNISTASRGVLGVTATSVVRWFAAETNRSEVQEIATDTICGDAKTDDIDRPNRSSSGKVVGRANALSQICEQKWSRRKDGCQFRHRVSNTFLALIFSLRPVSPLEPMCS
jgi:hypothetical protein